jgi:hypothetical protein
MFLMYEEEANYKFSLGYYNEAVPFQLTNGSTCHIPFDLCGEISLELCMLFKVIRNASLA